MDCKATNWLVVMLVDYCISKQLNHLYITFDIDVNGGESDMKNIQLGRKQNMMEMHIWYSWNLDIFHLCFHQCQRGRLLAWMLMVFLWGSILIIGEYVAWLKCYIHDYVCHWWQDSIVSIKTSRVADRFCGCIDKGLTI